MHKTRQLILHEDTEIPDAASVVYVMSRDQRLADNHALIAAQEEALKNQLPLVVLFNLHTSSGHRAQEHYSFMLDGLKSLENSLKDLNITFILRQGDAFSNITKTVDQLKAIVVFFDFNPLRGVRRLQKRLSQTLPCRVVVVDTHNIIPVWSLSDKEEYAAHTIRTKVHRNLADWLSEPKKIQSHPYVNDFAMVNDWAQAYKTIRQLPQNSSDNRFNSGEDAAQQELQLFINNRLENYATERNIPVIEGQSELSPYLHFGQISALRVALNVIESTNEPPLLLKRAKLASFEGIPTRQDSVDAFLEELIVRKELADNYCFYNENYDSIDGAKDWARSTLEQHRDDKRDYIYSRNEWEQATTHDKAWNAAQQEMMQTGKMHGYMRMYWAKKILEWSPNPEEAIQTAIYLNDHYSIDGGDPNGYTGIMWSIAGVHDRPWFEREVFGKIRYMNQGGLKRRFDLAAYCQKWTSKDI